MPRRPAALPAPTEFARPENYEAMIIRNAVWFRVNLFVGRGHWERYETPGFRDAIETAKAMQRAYPSCTRLPIIYAINSAGDSAACLGWERLKL